MDPPGGSLHGIVIICHHLVECGPIVTKLDIEIAGYDICIVNKYKGIGQMSMGRSQKT